MLDTVAVGIAIGFLTLLAQAFPTHLVTTVSLLAARLGIAFYAARYIVSFSLPQAVFLTLVAAAIEMRYLRHRAAGRFQPFSFTISPKYGKILTDAGLLADEAELGDFLRAKDMDGSALARGVEGVVLSYNPDSPAHTVVWLPSRSSSKSDTEENPISTPTRIDFSTAIKHTLARIDLDLLGLPLALKYPAGCRTVDSLTAHCEIKPGRHGFHIMMRINDQWWKARWAECPTGKPSFSEYRDPFEFPDAPNERLANVELTVAVIPYTEFQCFYRWRFTLDVSARRRRKALRGLNWKADEYDPSRWNQFRTIEHAYVTVYHEPVDRG